MYEEICHPNYSHMKNCHPNFLCMKKCHPNFSHMHEEMSPQLFPHEELSPQLFPHEDMSPQLFPYEKLSLWWSLVCQFFTWSHACNVIVYFSCFRACVNFVLIYLRRLQTSHCLWLYIYVWMMHSIRNNWTTMLRRNNLREEDKRQLSTNLPWNAIIFSIWKRSYKLAEGGFIALGWPIFRGWRWANILFLERVKMR